MLLIKQEDTAQHPGMYTQYYKQLKSTQRIHAVPLPGLHNPLNVQFKKVQKFLIPIWIWIKIHMVMTFREYLNPENLRVGLIKQVAQLISNIPCFIHVLFM